VRSHNAEDQFLFPLGNPCPLPRVTADHTVCKYHEV